MAEESEGQFVEVPISALSLQALKGVAESFVLREGTDYGHNEFSLEEKAEQIIAQLNTGRAILVFNHKEESFDIIRAK